MISVCINIWIEDYWIGSIEHKRKKETQGGGG